MHKVERRMVKLNAMNTQGDKINNSKVGPFKNLTLNVGNLKLENIQKPNSSNILIYFIL